MNEIAVIIVTYNRKELLKKCIEALKRQTVQSFDIIIIDNASTDGTNELFKKDLQNIIYYNTGKNLGGAGGFNFGIRKAVEAGYKYFWIMDDDTFPTETALEAFLKCDKDLKGNYGFLSGKVLWKDNSICAMNRQKINKWRYLKNFNERKKIQYASFVSFFVKGEVVKEIGLPIKDFFIWADDWEYARRISKEKECYFVPESKVVHWCNSNVGADIINSPSDRLDRFKYMYRNDVVLYRLDGFEGRLYLFVRTIIHFLRILFKADLKKEKIKLMLSSLKKGKNFYPNIEFAESGRDI